MIKVLGYVIKPIYIVILFIGIIMGSYMFCNCLQYGIIEGLTPDAAVGSTAAAAPAAAAAAAPAASPTMMSSLLNSVMGGAAAPAAVAAAAPAAVAAAAPAAAPAVPSQAVPSKQKLNEISTGGSGSESIPPANMPGKASVSLKESFVNLSNNEITNESESLDWVKNAKKFAAKMNIKNAKQNAKVPVSFDNSDMFFFANNQYKYECCNESPYSSTGGCPCMSKEQINFLYTRGGNTGS